MFHVKHRRGLLAVLAAFALLAGGCVGLTSPEGWAAPVLEDDTLFVQLERGTISAGTLSSAGTFTEVWRYPAATDDLDFDGFYATPVVVGDTVYIASYDGNVVALDTRTGRPVWPSVIELEANVVATPVVNGLFIYVPTEEGDVVVLDRENGTETNRLLDRDGRVWSAPVVGRGNLYVGKLDARDIWAVRASDGSVEWTQDVGGAVSTDLVLAGDLILAGSLDRALHAFDTTAGGRERWSYQAGGWLVAAPLVAGDVIYGATLRGEIFALDARSGDENWLQIEGGLEFRARPILLGGVLVLADRDGRLRGLDPATGDVRWENNLSDAKLFADPLALDGSIVYLTKDGELLRVSPSDGSVVSAAGRGG